jgi:hypothetical protein
MFATATPIFFGVAICLWVTLECIRPVRGNNPYTG